MDNASQMLLFVRTVDDGSFSAAARAHGVTPSAVSKQIRRLEDRLGVRLLHRSTRALTLTDEGRTFYERCVRIAHEIAEAEDLVTSMGDHVCGSLRVVANVAFAKAHLLPVFPELLKRHPELSLALELTDRPVDLVEEAVDVAIRFTEEITDHSAVARRLTSFERVVCASPTYLSAHGVPRTPEDLARHNCLRRWTALRWNEWHFDGAGGPRIIRVAGNFEANSADAVYHAALAGTGVARLSAYLVADDLRTGRLVHLLPDYEPEVADVFVVYPARANVPPKVRAFIEFLAERFTDRPTPARVADARAV